MDYFSAFEVSAAGMGIERLRLDVSAINLANAHTTRGPEGALFKPLRVVAHTNAALPFEAVLQSALFGLSISPYADVSVETTESAPRQAYEPGHPDADERGFVSYPDVNPVSEMLNLVTVTRAYEANVRAMNIAKSMALKALEIGGGR